MSRGEDTRPLDERIMALSLAAYRTRDQRVAMRGALGDAAALCDALAKAQLGPSPPKRTNAQMRAILAAMKACGDAIWEMREKVPVRVVEEKDLNG